MDAQTYMLTKVAAAAFIDEMEKLASFRKMLDRISKWSLRAGEKAGKDKGVSRREFLRRAGIRAVAPVAGRAADIASGAAKGSGVLAATTTSKNIGRRSAMKRFAAGVGGAAAASSRSIKDAPGVIDAAKKLVRSGEFLPKTTFSPVGKAMRAARHFGAGAVGRGVDKAALRKIILGQSRSLKDVGKGMIADKRVGLRSAVRQATKGQHKRGREVIKAYPEVALETLMGALG